MPRKNGIQVVQEVRAYIAARQKDLGDALVIQEPEFVFLTAFKTPTFSNHLASL